MSIVVIIEQKCDRCKDSRELKEKTEGHHGGWREVQTNKHLCPNCIHGILEEADK